MTQAGTESNPLTGRYTPAPVSGYTRRKTREVKVGAVGIGGDNPIRIQSMTISDTMDTAATVKESIALFEAGSEIVRITAPSWKDAENLGVIKAEFKKAGLDIPICADIHFSPKAAMFAVEHVEKVRINPGNFVDQKKFKVREYTDTEYTAELERLHEAFTPLVLRAKELGRALRIGTNHGSLSDRIMNRYGDTPAGMVASAIEFIQIAEDHSFHDIVISMKASNVQVMVQAYRMLVERMDALGMDYPLHLGVTEAGDGQDGRIKSAAGIGSLLDDGLGDTIRVSLTEDPIHELPVARALANRFDKARDRIASSLWLPKGGPALTLDGDFQSTIDPYAYSRREASPCFEGPWLAQTAGPVGLGLPVDFAELSANNSAATLLAGAVREGADLLLLRNANIQAASDWAAANRPALAGAKLILEQSDIIRPQATTLAAFDGVSLTLAADREPASEELDLIQAWQGAGKTVFVHLTPVTASIDLDGMRKVLAALTHAAPERLVLSLEDLDSAVGRTGDLTRRYRMLTALLEEVARENSGTRVPIFLRATFADLEDGVYDAAYGLGGLLVDGIGDLILCDFNTPVALGENLRLSLDILQAMRLRMSKTEYISCPSCGRTLFDLQETTARIKERTGHLKGVKIAVMGCIVNGPGEMADADFGYVGAGPGKIHLYHGKELVKPNIPSASADEELVELIKEHGMWVEPEKAAAVAD